MEKPWDKLRKHVEPKKPPIGCGVWRTSTGSGVRVSRMTDHTAEVCLVDCKDEPWSQGIHAQDARELSEFFAELADQLQGK